MPDLSVLLVDDEPDFVAALAERLEVRGLSVDTAASGTLALDKARAKIYDAVLLDMAMPGLDGLDTLRGLLGINPDQQVILLTGRATLQQAVEAMKLGALDLLEKPADIGQLVARIEDAANRRIALDDRRVEERVRDIIHKKGW